MPDVTRFIIVDPEGQCICNRWNNGVVKPWYFQFPGQAEVHAEKPHLRRYGAQVREVRVPVEESPELVPQAGPVPTDNRNVAETPSLYRKHQEL